MKQFFSIIDGPMGSGKTTISKLVHEKVDNVALLGLDRVKWTLSGFNRTSEQNAMTGKVVRAMARAYLENGASVLLDQGFNKADSMSPYLDLAVELSIPYFVFQLKAPDEVLLARLAKRPMPNQARTPVSHERIVHNIIAHHNGKYKHASTYDTTTLSPAEIADQIISKLQKF